MRYLFFLFIFSSYCHAELLDHFKGEGTLKSFNELYAVIDTGTQTVKMPRKYVQEKNLRNGLEVHYRITRIDLQSVTLVSGR